MIIIDNSLCLKCVNCFMRIAERRNINGTTSSSDIEIANYTYKISEETLMKCLVIGEKITTNVIKCNFHAVITSSNSYPPIRLYSNQLNEEEDYP